MLVIVRACLFVDRTESTISPLFNLAIVLTPFRLHCPVCYMVPINLCKSNNACPDCMHEDCNTMILFFMHSICFHSSPAMILHVINVKLTEWKKYVTRDDRLEYSRAICNNKEDLYFHPAFWGNG